MPVGADAVLRVSDRLLWRTNDYTRGLINGEELTVTALQADPRPRTISERLLLLGWLLPRPAVSPRHPARYMLPPELRRWAPRPLAVPSLGAAPPAPAPPALRVVTVLLLTCAERPLAIRADRRLRRTSVRALAARLGLMERDTEVSALPFLMPLLTTLGVLAPRHGRCVLTPAGQRWLTLSPEAQLARLRDAWIAQPSPDAWLSACGVDRRGIDGPALRRRLVAWVDALPPDVRLDPATLTPALTTTLGPPRNDHRRMTNDER
jgi:hypothetical protein